MKEFIDYGKPVYITDEILKCMNIISKKTNNLIKFVPKNKNKMAVKFIYDTNLSSEGIASLGKKNNDNVVKFKNVNYRVIIHELLHILGLFHEFNRYDRDKFIKIEEILKGNNNTSTIKRPYILDYEYNLPYDIFSCMHYNYEYNFKLKDKYDENFIKILNIFLIYKLIFQPINSDKVLTDIDIEKIKFKYQ